MLTLLTYGALIGVTVVAIGLIVWLVLRSTRPLIDKGETTDPDAARSSRAIFGLTKSDWAAIGHWITYRFGAWFSGSFVMVAMFLLVCWGIYLGMQFDGAYAARWAPTEEDESTFRSYGWMISVAMVILTSVSVLAFRKGAWFSGIISGVAGVYFLFLSVTQSVGFVAIKAEEMTRAATTFEETVQAEVDTRQALIDELGRQRDQLNELVKERRGDLTGEIGQYITDGKNNDDLADDSRDRRTDIEKKQDEDLAALNARILCLKGDKTQCLEEEKQVETDDVEGSGVPPRRHDPVVEIMAFWAKGGPADNEFKDNLTVRYLPFWSIGAPLIGLMLSVFLMINRHKKGPDKEKKISPWKTFKQKTWKERLKPWEQIPNPDRDGVVEKEFTQEEWEWIQKAMNHRKNYEEGQDMKIPPRVKIGNREWIKEQKRDIVSLMETGYTPEEIAENKGMTLSEFEQWVRKFFKPRYANKILRAPKEKAPANGTDLSDVEVTVTTFDLSEGGDDASTPNG